MFVAFLPAIHERQKENADLLHQITSQQFDFARDFIFCDDFAFRLTMLPKKRRRSWPLQAKQRRRDDRTVTLSQIGHLSLRYMFIRFAKQYDPIPRHIDEQVAAP